MWLKSMVDDVVYVPRARRISFDMLVRYRHHGQRATGLVKDLTCGGARIEGLSGLRVDESITLYLPGLKPKDARVAWVAGYAAGLEFERPLHPDIFETLVLHHATSRERTSADETPVTDPAFIAAPSVSHARANPLPRSLRSAA